MSVPLASRRVGVLPVELLLVASEIRPGGTPGGTD